MPKNSFLRAIFPKIKYSVSPIEKPVKGNVKIGQIVPVYKTIIQGKESVRLDMSHLLRFMPTNVPVMEGYRVDFDAFKVPVSSLAYPIRKERDVMDFHNLALNDGEVPNPFSKSLTDLHYLSRDGGRTAFPDVFRVRSLADYLNFPSLKSLRDRIREWIASTPLFDGPFPYDMSEQDAATTLVERLFYNTPANKEVAGAGVAFTPDAPYYAVDVDNPAIGFADDQQGEGHIYDYFISGVYSLFAYICKNYPQVANYYHVPVNFFSSASDRVQIASDLILLWNGSDKFDLNYLDVLYRLYKIDAQTIYNEWFESVFACIAFNDDLFQITSALDGLNGETMMDAGYLPDVWSDDMKPIDWTYFAAYWKIISDWYINTNIDGDPNDFFLKHFNIWDVNNPLIDNEPFKRRWINDIFTSSVPSSKVINVLIPTDGTIPDLRTANAFQRVKDILRNTGSRLRDVMDGIRGYRPSADASDMAIPVGTVSHYVGISSVLQTSQTTPESAQASYSGVGTSNHGFEKLLKVINNDEPTPVVVMVLMSVTQLPTYTQGFPREFFRNSIYDFAIPQLANVGEQEVTYPEVYFDYDPDGDNSLVGTFGFNRRYYDWFFEQAEVHGDLRDSEDVWTGSRIFDSRPYLDSEFIGIDSERDHLDRIFANSSPAAANIYYNVVFSGEKIVALPRYQQYDL